MLGEDSDMVAASFSHASFERAKESLLTVLVCGAAVRVWLEDAAFYRGTCGWRGAIRIFKASSRDIIRAGRIGTEALCAGVAFVAERIAMARAVDGTILLLHPIAAPHASVAGQVVQVFAILVAAAHKRARWWGFCIHLGRHHDEDEDTA